jgi:hypothetical protein
MRFIGIGLIDYKTSMVTYAHPLRGYLCYQDLGFSHTLHVCLQTDADDRHMNIVYSSNAWDERLSGC